MDKDKQALLKIIASEVHKPVIRNFKRRKVITKSPNETWAADLVDMNDQLDQNDGYRYMLNVIDIYSRFAWIVPMKTKTADSTLDAFKEVVKSAKTTPKNYWVDEGKEFYNSKMEKYNEIHNINMYSTFGPHKSAMIERFNRTIKEKMYYYFTESDNNNWVNEIANLLKTYNNTVHSSTNQKPIDRIKNTDKEAIKDNIEDYKEDKSEKVKTAKYKVGDLVRTTYVKKVFDKGYKPKWSQEIYRIVKIAKTNPVTYIIEDLLKEKIKGKMYEQEIQKTKQEVGGLTLIEKVLETKKQGKKTMQLVKWLGYPEKFNSWVEKIVK